jgi:hypothetical protein
MSTRGHTILISDSAQPNPFALSLSKGVFFSSDITEFAAQNLRSCMILILFLFIEDCGNTS